MKICLAPEGAGNGGTPPPDQNADPLKNMKAEFDRKLDGLQTQLKATTDALLAKLSEPKIGSDKKNLPSEKKPFSQRIYDDPDAAAADLVNEAEERVMTNLRRVNEHAQKEQRIVSELRSEYPELYDVKSDLATKAIELFGKLPEDERIPAMYRSCVREAADELGLVPKKKRTGQNEDFTLGGNGGGNRGEGRGAGKGTIDDKTLAFAAAVGIDVSDEKTVERLKTRHRTDREWLQYRS